MHAVGAAHVNPPHLSRRSTRRFPCLGSCRFSLAQDASRQVVFRAPRRGTSGRVFVDGNSMVFFFFGGGGPKGQKGLLFAGALVVAPSLTSLSSLPFSLSTPTLYSLCGTTQQRRYKKNSTEHLKKEKKRKREEKRILRDYEATLRRLLEHCRSHEAKTVTGVGGSNKMA